MLQVITVNSGGVRLPGKSKIISVLFWPTSQTPALPLYSMGVLTVSPLNLLAKCVAAKSQETIMIPT